MTALQSPISTPHHNLRETVPADELVYGHNRRELVPTVGPLLAFAQAILSFGLLPLLLWPTRWATFVEAERTDLLELISRWGSRLLPAEVRQLDQLTNRIKPRPMLIVLPWLVVAFNGVLMISLLSQGDTFHRLWDLTFQHARVYQSSTGWVDGTAFEFHHARTQSAFNGIGMDARSQLESHLFTVWAWGLVFAYACHWYAVRSHAAAVHSLIKWTNRLATVNQLPQVRSESLAVGLGPLWIIAGIVLCSMNAWWGIPLVLAGAMQRRYSHMSSPRMLSALGSQLRDGFAIGSTDGMAWAFCNRAHCGARMPPTASFCPRCGSAAVSAR